MTEDEIETHRAHCCVLHRCKYSDRNCPVIKRRVKQEYLCEYCRNEGLKKIPDPDDPDFDLLEMTELELRKECSGLRAEMRKAGLVLPESNKTWILTLRVKAVSKEAAVANLSKAEVTGCREERKDNWKGDPDYPRSDWVYEVSNGDDLCDYWDWVEKQKEAAGDE